MSRRWLGRAAVRLYPENIRAARGNELLGTLLEAGAHSRLTFLGQLWSVVIAGLLARSRDASAQPVRRIAFDTTRWCVVLTVSLQMIAVVVAAARWEGGSVPITFNTICPALILVAFVLKRDRAAGLVGAGLCIHALITVPFASASLTIEEFVLLVGFAFMTLAPRRRSDDLRLLVLLPLLAQAFLHWTLLGLHSGAGRLLPALAAAVLVTVKPPLMLGTAWACSLLALSYTVLPTPVAGIELLCCTPAALALAGLSRHVLRLARP